jgi:hypothetical protein
LTSLPPKWFENFSTRFSSLDGNYEEIMRTGSEMCRLLFAPTPTAQHQQYQQYFTMQAGIDELRTERNVAV